MKKPDEYIGKTIYHLSYINDPETIHFTYYKGKVVSTLKNELVLDLIEEYGTNSWNEGADMISMLDLGTSWSENKEDIISNCKKLLSRDISSYKEHLNQIKDSPVLQDIIFVYQYYYKNMDDISVQKLKQIEQDILKHFEKRCKYKIGDTVKHKSTDNKGNKIEAISDIITLDLNLFETLYHFGPDNHTVIRYVVEGGDIVRGYLNEDEIIEKIS